MNETYDFIIIGAGVAGLSAAGYAARANMKTLVLESGGTGGQAQNIVHLENYPGVFPSVTGIDFIETMRTQAKTFGAEIKTETVLSLDKIAQEFVVRTNSGQYTALTILLATGSSSRKLGCKGEKELSGKGVSYCATCDGPFFKGKKILVVGGGDSACDEATFLSTLSPQITVIHRKSQFRAQKAVADRVLQNPNIDVFFNSELVEIQGQGKVQNVIIKDNTTGQTRSLEMDAVFIFIGADPCTELVPILKHDEDGYIVTDEQMRTSIPGLFCAGDVRSKSFRQVVTAASDGAIAAHSAEKYIRETNNEVYI